MKNLYNKSLSIIDKIESLGYECYFVGGCVRDKIIGFEINDYDLITNASEKALKSLYGNIQMVGNVHGIYIINGIEVSVMSESVSSFLEDSNYRDFTINSLYMNGNGNVLDFHGGMDDISNKLLKCVGKGSDRFKEDPSRILRALYLKSKLGYRLSDELVEDILKYGYLVEKVPDELKGRILYKVMKYGKLSEFMGDLMSLGLNDYIFKEFRHLYNLPQNPEYHKYDAWNHTLEVIKSAELMYPDDVGFILGSLYHDCAKGLEGVRGVNKRGEFNDIGHEGVGSDIAFENILKYGFGNKIAKEVKFYVMEHGVRFTEKSKIKSYVKWLRKISLNFNNINEMSEYVRKLIDFIECDASGFGDNLKEEILNIIPYMKDRVDYVTSNYIFYVSDLPVNGYDVMSITGVKGKEIRDLLEFMVLNNMSDYNKALTFLNNRSK